MNENNQIKLQKEVVEPHNLALYVPRLSKDLSIKMFNKIVPGDVIYAPTTKNVKNLATMGESHRSRPHYVVRKEVDKLITYSGTSNLSFPLEDFVFMDLTNYGLKKGGNVDIGKYKIIEETEVITVFCHLKPKDICKFNKKILETKYKDERNKVKKDHLLFPTPMDEVAIGSIVYHGGILCCVYDVSASYISVCALKEDVTENVFVIDEKIYSIDFEKRKSIQKKVNQTIFTIQVPDFKTLTIIEKDKEDTNYEFCLKKGEEDKREYTFKYPIGQIFKKERNGNVREFVYLFSVLDEDYGVEVLPKEKISKIKPFVSNLKRKKVLREEEIDDILNHVVSKNPDFAWLAKHVKDVRNKAKAQ